MCLLSYTNSAIIYPESTASTRPIENKQLNGQHDVFNSITSIVKKGIVRLVENSKQKLEAAGTESSSLGLTSLMAGAIAIALCRIRAIRNQVADSRICVLTAGKDNPSFYSAQYMNFMNVYFSAQKLVLILSLTCFNLI